jgi:putative spermidine/putrescine transport system ATP-binding protein
MTDAKNTTGAAVTLKGVRKQYGKFVALDGIDLEVPAGSFCTFLGPSGSGKTTTLNIVGGLTTPDRGTVSIGDVDATRMAADKRGLGFVFQSYALFPHMTAARNIAYPLKLRGIGGAEGGRKVAEALELVRLTQIADRYPSQLSGGQQQRVALARAFVFGPKVLLMDEPLSALDAGLRAHLQREIVRITRELGCTVLYVTHDQEEALAMSDQIVLFNDGRIEQRGSPIDIYSNPETEFAARFVGNGRLVHGVLDGGRADCVLRTSGGHRIPVDVSSTVRHGLRSGDRAAAVFRPETLTLRRGGNLADGGPDSLCEGIVSDAIFAGGQVKVVVDIGEASELECRSGLRDGPWRPGDQVTLHVEGQNLPVVVPSTRHPVPEGTNHKNLDPVPN